MPELPEVETIRLQLTDLIKNKKIQKITILDPKLKKNLTETEIKFLTGQKIIDVTRQAKVLLWKLESGKYLAFHLKMTGRIIYRDAKITSQKLKIEEADLSALPNKHTRAIVEFSHFGKIYFQDLRRFGWIKLVNQSEVKGGLLKTKIGPEPLSKEFTKNYLKAIFAKAKKPVKVFLLDQEKIGGIGNIYANEALFLAKIHPRTPVNKLSQAKIVLLTAAIIKVIKKGIKYGGASDNDYRDVYGEKGSFQDHFLVYRKNGQPCPSCKTILQRIKLGGRGTFFCPKCQK